MKLQGRYLSVGVQGDDVDPTCCPAEFTLDMIAANSI